VTAPSFSLTSYLKFLKVSSFSSSQYRFPHSTTGPLHVNLSNKSTQACGEPGTEPARIPSEVPSEVRGSRFFAWPQVSLNCHDRGSASCPANTLGLGRNEALPHLAGPVSNRPPLELGDGRYQSWRIHRRGLCLVSARTSPYNLSLGLLHNIWQRGYSQYTRRWAV